MGPRAHERQTQRRPGQRFDTRTNQALLDVKASIGGQALNRYRVGHQTFSRFWPERSSSDKFVTVLVAMYEIEAAIFSAAEEGDVFHDVWSSEGLKAENDDPGWLILSEYYYRGARSPPPDLTRSLSLSLDLTSNRRRNRHSFLPRKMPTVAVDKADLWERLGQEYCTHYS